MKKVIFISLGSIFVFIGIMGIFLPLVPATIFLIIVSYFFRKSSPELNERLLNNMNLGESLRNYQEKNGMLIKSKISSICLLWISILISCIYLTERTAIRIILRCVAVGVTIYITTIKNLNFNLLATELFQH